ncbi:unnamed protein product, partial [Mesorhabditis spiculigera]
IINPSGNVLLVNVNVTDNNGRGISILTANLQANNGDPPSAPQSLPYFARGLVDMCASTKKIDIKGRLLLYYKYDAHPVDCVKIFSAGGKHITFRFLQVNLYSAPTDLGRSDALRVYSSDSMQPSTLIAKYARDIDGIPQPDTTPFSQPIDNPSISLLALHFRGTAADPHYGFIAEVAVASTPAENAGVGEVVIAAARMDNNDRGGVRYENTGELSPKVVIEECSMFRNGIHLYGNISTTMHAASFYLHNTQLLLFRANSLAHNRGGILIDSISETAMARLNAVIKANLFSFNTNSTVIELKGNGFQKATMVNNVISHNYAFYHDTVYAVDVIVNMTRNTITNNTGLHTLDIRTAKSKGNSEPHLFLRNNFEFNHALGHGHQYIQRYGHELGWMDEFQLYKRPKRQVSYPVFRQEGVSFDWWTHVDQNTDRYRSTVYAGSSRQHFLENVFNNPANELDLTTSNRTNWDIGAVDAKENYWGWPSTESVAAGRIRDGADLPYLIRVEYTPVFESNTSLIEGDCRAGWFQVGKEEYKSCYLYVGGAATYERAVEYCEELGAFLLYLNDDDPRQKEMAERIDMMERRGLTELEQTTPWLRTRDDIHIWVGSASFAWPQCGYLSTRTSRTQYDNCQALRPFVCEKGILAYKEPPLWRREVVLFVVLAVVAIVFLILLGCWPTHESALGSISASPLHAYGTSNYYSKRSQGADSPTASTNTYETTSAL